jgi:mRNA interferase RelE/StbE
LAWQIKIESAAEKQLRKLDSYNREKILKYLRKRLSTCINPRDFGKPLEGNLSGFWRYRVEDYRIICKIEDSEIKILVLKVAHRNEIYKKQP